VARVILLGLDGFPNRAISAELTPRIWKLAREGGRAPDGGVTDLPSSTDPGFCSLLTGCRPPRHGVRTTSWRFTTLPAWVGSQKPQVPTIFEVCRAARVATAAVVADDRGLLCTDAASLRWPPDGVIPAATTLDAHGYPTNAAVLPQVLSAIADATIPFVFGHLNEADTVGHDEGPESSAARQCYAMTDAAVGEILDAARDRWSDTIVVIVSDHDMQPRDASPPIDVLGVAGGALWDLAIPDGGSALVHLCPGVDSNAAGKALKAIDGIETWQPGVGLDSVVIAGARPGRIFLAPRYSARGFHGAPVTARTVAIVGGGHPAVRRIAQALARRRPHLADWVPTLAPLLGVELTGADGVNLLA
jgi:hypothetical protein